MLDATRIDELWDESGGDRVAFARMIATEVRGSRQLSQRQIQLLALMSDGATNREAASTMGIAADTAKEVAAAARAKLGASTTAQAIAIAIREGLLQ